MRPVLAAFLVLALVGCVPTPRNPVPERPTFDVEGTLLERWQQCFTLLGTPEATVAFDQAGADPAVGIASVATGQGVVVFDIGLSQDGSLLTIPATEESFALLGTVGC